MEDILTVSLTAPEAVSASLGDVKYVAVEAAGGVLAGNVKAYGAVGDGNFHEKLAYFVENSWGEYLVGHYSRLELKVQHAPYLKDEFYPDLPEDFGFSSPLTVVADDAEAGEGEIRLSQVRPYPMYEGKAGQFTHGAPAVGDRVVEFYVADNERSVPAHDDSEAFERAIAACDGVLYLPEGNFVVSQVTAAKIRSLYGAGRVWIREWQGGVLYYYMSGTSERLRNYNYGFADPEVFTSVAWRSMHWIEAPQVRSLSEAIQSPSGERISPVSQYAIDPTREAVNVWFWIEPTVEEDEFPDEVTVCFSKDTAAYYTLSGDYTWHRSSMGGIEFGYYLYSDYTGEEKLDVDYSQYTTDCGDWVEVKMPKELTFYHKSGENVAKTALHAWTPEPPKTLDFSENAPECQMGYSKVWLKNPKHNALVSCTMGQDMRSSWKRYETIGSFDDYCHESFTTEAKRLYSAPTEFYGYCVPEELFSSYMSEGDLIRAKALSDPYGRVGISYLSLDDIPAKLEERIVLAEGTFTMAANSGVCLAVHPSGRWETAQFSKDYFYMAWINGKRYILEGTDTDLQISDANLYVRFYSQWSDSDDAHYIYMETNIAGEYEIELSEYDVSPLNELLLPTTAVRNDVDGMLSYNRLSDAPCRLGYTNTFADTTVTAESDGSFDLGAAPSGASWWNPSCIYALTVNGETFYREPTVGEDGSITLEPFGDYTVWIDSAQYHVYAYLRAGQYEITLKEYAFKRLSELVLPESTVNTISRLSSAVTELQAAVSELTGSAVGGTYKISQSAYVTSGTEKTISADVSGVQSGESVILRVKDNGCLDTSGDVWIQYSATIGGETAELKWVNYYTGVEFKLPEGATALSVYLPSGAVTGSGTVTFEIIVVGVSE